MSAPSPNQPRNLFPNTPNHHSKDPNPPPSVTSVEPSPITVLNHNQHASSSSPNSEELRSPSSTYQLDHLIDVALSSQSPMATQSKYKVREMGPLESDPAHTGTDMDTDTDAHIGGGECGENRKWTVIVNDVNHFVPSLFEWIMDNFAMVPQWRRDNGQISLSNQGGGIGAHVDDYDVYLIQMSRRRQWDVGNRVISTKEELEGLIPLDVRILNFWDEEVEEGLVQSFVLEPGDALYLPPRFGHRGTALTDKCMTISVGL